VRPGLFGENNGARSYLTFLMFLNDDYDGGRTTLINPRDHSDRLEIEPTPGSVLVTQHDVFHAGAPVDAGEKWVMRTDVMYEPVCL